MWFECADCLFATNTPRSANEHEDKTGHRVLFDSFDWTDE